MALPVICRQYKKNPLAGLYVYNPYRQINAGFTGQVIKNYGYGKESFDLQNGTTAGADANDMTYAVNKWTADANDMFTIPSAVTAKFSGATGATGIFVIKRGPIGAVREIMGLNSAAALTKASMYFNAANNFLVRGRAKTTDAANIQTSTATFTDVTNFHTFGFSIDLPNSTIKSYYDGLPITATGTVVFGQTTFDSDFAGTCGIFYHGGGYQNGELAPFAIGTKPLTAAQHYSAYRELKKIATLGGLTVT